MLARDPIPSLHQRVMSAQCGKPISCHSSTGGARQAADMTGQDAVGAAFRAWVVRSSSIEDKLHDQTVRASLPIRLAHEAESRV